MYTPAAFGGGSVQVFMLNIYVKLLFRNKYCKIFVNFYKKKTFRLNKIDIVFILYYNFNVLKFN